MPNIIYLPIIVLSDISLGLCLVEILKIERLNSYLKLLLSFYLNFSLKTLMYYAFQFADSFNLLKYCFRGLSFLGIVSFFYFIYKKGIKKDINYFFCIELAIFLAYFY